MAQITLDANTVVTIIETAITDYAAYQAGSAITTPAVNATLGTTKVKLAFTFVKKATGTATSELPPTITPNVVMGIIGALYADFNSFEAGNTVKTPEVDVRLGSDIVGLTLSISKG